MSEVVRLVRECMSSGERRSRLVAAYRTVFIRRVPERVPNTFASVPNYVLANEGALIAETL